MPRPAPLATYRLQLHAKFGFDDAIAIAGYLRDLGVSHVYSSPYLQAAAGSTHGYDVVDHNRVNVELGGAAAHERYCLELGRAGLGQVLDIVPNHMAIGTRANAQWWDVLENGQAAAFADLFDVEWNPPEAKLRDTVLLPVLGDQYGRVLENGDFRIDREGGKFVLRYFDHAFPLAPDSMSGVVARAAERGGSDELSFLADSLSRLPRPTWTDRASKERRHRNKEVIARELVELCDHDANVAKAVGDELAAVNADYDALDAILNQQNYRLAYWRTAGRDLGYRRFFDVNTLVGIRMEDERVFQFTHNRVLEWLRRGVLDGIRVDHPDGLRDPETYFDRLHEAAPDAWIVAEKILEPGERLRETWPVAGTTGYDFLHRAGQVLVDPNGREPLTRFYAEFTGESVNLREMVRARKEQVLRGGLGSDVNRLTQLFVDVCEGHRRYRDFTRHDIHQALRVVIACFPVYRTYISPEPRRLHPDDVAYVNEAIDCAKGGREDIPGDLFDFMRSVLLMEATGDRETEFLMRFQQFTGPAMAKGVEDTTFYVFNRLVSLNEVGGNPGEFGMSVERFHELSADTQRHWPTTMLATSTHDTKRSEDVRARINLLSEIPERWMAAVMSWSQHNERYRRGNWPDRNMEYLLYQTLVGAWPIDADRLGNYMEKSSREAKTHTSWTEPNVEYDEALQGFVRHVCGDEDFLRRVSDFVGPLVWPGRVNSLAQTVLKLTTPGVPDLYQGTEIWDLSLVDPDNRRPVDYELRKRLLSELDGLSPEQIVGRADDGLPKLWLTRQVLRLRRERPEAFGSGSDYQVIEAQGERSRHAIAFLRGGSVAAVAPRLPIGLGDDWRDTTVRLPEGRWENALTGDAHEGGELSLREVLARFPVAVLKRS